ncbi:MAG: Sjogren's syndrome/scleroderma autoantigen 1 family protein [Halobacteria archaeon]
MASDDETDLMSEYLLKGATMLGEHCENCGNPLFKLKGETVCPVCIQKNRGEAEDDGGEQAQGSVSGQQSGQRATPCTQDAEGGEEGSGSVDSSGSGTDRPELGGGFSGPPAEREGVEEAEEIQYQQQVRENLWRNAAQLSGELSSLDSTEAKERKLELLDRTLEILMKYSR